MKEGELNANHFF